MTARLLKPHILVEDIPPEGLSVHYDDLSGLLENEEDIKTSGPVTGAVTLTRTGDQVYLSGNVEARLILSCDRCLEDFPAEVSTSFTYLFAPDSFEEPAERAMRIEDVELAPYDGIHIPIAHVFREQILLNIPERKLCSDTCKGICPNCGANLNWETCTCTHKDTDSAFTVLESLKKTTAPH
ncbi:MAG: DUF177 domain-containing protein [Deltaproteobacteria bacterium]